MHVWSINKQSQCSISISTQFEFVALIPSSPRLSALCSYQACFSVDGSFAQAGQHLEALKELCDTLSPEDAHRLAQTQLRECEKRLAAIQHQFSGDQDTSLPDARWDIKSVYSHGCGDAVLLVHGLVWILCCDRMLKSKMQIIFPHFVLSGSLLPSLRI